MKGKLIIVSNRLPFKIEKKYERYEIRQSSGGLVSAIQSIPRELEVLWIGVADFKEDVWLEYKKNSRGNNHNIEPIFVDRKIGKLYYDGFSNTTIWPLFHYFPSFAEYHIEFYQAYCEVNRIFSEKIKAIASEEDLIWIHDYHLMLLPGYLKEEPKPLSSSFFLHIPFPSYELVKLIPEDWRNEIIRSLISADVIGFQTQEYVSHFKKSLSFFLGKECISNTVYVNGHSSVIKEYPISIDFDQFHSAFDLPGVVKGRNGIRKKHGATKIIFSLDRLDYSKGVINRLLAYEDLIRSNPSLRGKIVFVINVIPSREQISKYAERKRMIEENISRINGLYGYIQWQPIIYQYQHLTVNELLSCYTACDVALVTPLRDGMNLVAKEFVASRRDLRGSLILSEFAGAANELRGAILVNPNDNSAMQRAISKAIYLSEAEQEERLIGMQKHLKTHDVKAWSSTYIGDLKDAKIRNKGARPNILSFEDKINILETYKAANKRLILLDYDGTLVRFYNKPEDALPGEIIKDLLSRLAENERNKVVIISGRDAFTLNDWFGKLGVDIAAEHGVLYKQANSNSWQSPGKIPTGWKNEIRELMQSYVDILPGSFIEEKEYTIVWHYRAVEDITVDTIKLKLTKAILAVNTKDEFEVLSGHKIVEVRSTHVNKGKVITDLLHSQPFDFVLALGDDITDEDMFRALTGKNHYSIKVGIAHTSARYNILNINSVLSFLDQLSLFKNRILN